MENIIYRIRVYYKDKIYSQTYVENIDLNYWLELIKNRKIISKIEFKKLIIKDEI